MANTQKYSDTAESLCERISALIPLHPEILEFESAWDLFNIPAFQCNDLDPSLAQAQGALSKAKFLAKVK